ncbi:hypothetical protein [Paracoccus sp. R86501]|uniref:hypothetical protein n=1 Tax=Paracoccus sp. R86501 TaxID=3101711 RepID=UPI00366D77BF
MTMSTLRVKAADRKRQQTEILSEAEETDLWNLEEGFWTNGLKNARATTAANAVMIVPYPPGILQGDLIWDHLERNTGWRSVSMVERSAVRHGDIVILTYQVSAEKPAIPIYEALCASTYLQDEGRWLRISHQQAPSV